MDVRRRSQQLVLNLVVIDCQTNSDNDGFTDYEESFLCTAPSLFDTNGMVAIRDKNVIMEFTPIL